MDHGTARAERIASESCQQADQKELNVQCGGGKSSRKICGAVGFLPALMQPTARGQLAVLCRMTRIPVILLESSEWTHSFERFGLKAHMFKALVNGYIRECEARNKSIDQLDGSSPDAIDALFRMHGETAAADAQAVLEEFGITVGIRYCWDPVQNRGYYDFIVPTSSSQQDAWREGLVKKYGLSHIDPP
jgi:hypothetical protein